MASAGTRKRDLSICIHVNVGIIRRMDAPAAATARWELYRLLGEPVRLRLLALAAEEELAAKQAELDQAEDELQEALERLRTLKGRLKRALINLRERLVAIYTYGSTDITSVRKTTLVIGWNAVAGLKGTLLNRYGP